MTIRLLPAVFLALAHLAPAHAAPAGDSASAACAGMGDKRARKLGPGRPQTARCAVQAEEAQ